MAVANICGNDSQYYGWDISQFNTDEEKVLLSKWIHYLKESWGAFSEDGLIYFVPEMVLAPWSWPNDDLMKQKVFFVHMPWEDGALGMNWTPFYERVRKEFNWRCFKVDPPYVSNNYRFVFYKYGMMPEEPTLSDIGIPGGRQLGHYFFDENTVEQGYIVYKNKEIWEEVNHAMASNDDYHPFLRAIENYQIMM